MKEQRAGAPVFVKVDEYKDILDVLEMIKGKVKEIRNMLDSINSLQKQEHDELDMWTNSINDIESKIDNIEKLMFEPEQMR